MYDSHQRRFLVAALAFCCLAWGLVYHPSVTAQNIPAQSTGGGQAGTMFGLYQSTCRVDIQAACTATWAPGYGGLLGSEATVPRRCYRDDGTFSVYFTASSCTTDPVLSCPYSYTLSGNQCVPTPVASAKQLAFNLSALDQRIIVPADHAGLGFCYQGFAMVAEWGAVHQGDLFNKVLYPPFTADGTACSETVATTPTPATSQQVSQAVPPSPFVGCKGFAGYVNGQEKCIPHVADNGVEAISSVSGVQTDSTGTTVKTGSVTCSGSTCESTVTTTVTPVGGSATSSMVTTSQSKAEFCTQNPKAGVCADMVEDECNANPARLGCQDIDSPATSIPSSTVEVGFSPVDVGIGAGSCPSPIEFNTVLGTNSINLASFCNALTSYVRPVIIALGALMAFMIAWPRGAS